MDVDEVYLRLRTVGVPAAERAHVSAVAKYAAMAATPGRNKKLLRRAEGPCFQYNGKKNNKGRWTWSAKVSLPPGARSPCLDALPPGALQAAWHKDSLGEFMLYLNFEARVHHKTLEKILRKEGLLVIYIKGATVSTLRQALADPAWDRICKRALE